MSRGPVRGRVCVTLGGRSSPALALGLATILASSAAWSDPPDPAKVRNAADQFDAGSRAFESKQFEAAASHFEAADAAVPSPKALRFAIRSRVEAGQGSRAATLAAQALARYPADKDSTRLANETLEKLEPVLHRVDVSCASPCVLAVGTRAIPGQATTRWVVYLDPGRTEIGASFFGGVGGGRQGVEAKAGGKSELRFEPSEDSSGPPPAAAAPPSAGSGESSQPPPEPAPQTGPSASSEPDAAASPRSGLSPAFFVVGLVATAGLGGVTIWSGIATQNDPGPDAVREQCRGKGTSCPTYQDGLAAEMRTNVLLGATIGAAVVTVALGAFFTDWGGDAPRESAGIAPLPGGGALATIRRSF